MLSATPAMRNVAYRGIELMAADVVRAHQADFLLHGKQQCKGRVRQFAAFGFEHRAQHGGDP